MGQRQEKQLPEICTADELQWLAHMAAKNGYAAPTPMGNGRYCCIVPFIFTTGIITGRMGDDYGYTDRWCFEHIGAALTALFDWAGKDFEGEPQGWHRHPDSGRRRPDGDAGKEYINR
jgi:hypothetical protein